MALDRRGNMEAATKPLLFQRISLFAVLLMGWTLWLLGGRNAADGTGTTIANVLWALSYLVGIGALLRDRPWAISVLRLSMPLICILGLVVLSAVWSDSHALTVRRSLQLIGTTVLVLWFVRSLGLRVFVDTLILAATVAALFSLYLILYVPDQGLELEGEWAGALDSKNHLGQAMDLGMLTILCAFSRKRLVQIAQVAAFILFFVLLVGSKNGTGLATTLILAVAIPMFLFSRSRRSIQPLLFGGLVAGVLLFAALIIGLGSDEAFGVIGKDSTLTGRTTVWMLVASAIADKLALGYGYGAFWGIGYPAEGLVYAGTNWKPHSAHNGFLEVAVNIGLAGELLFLLFLILAVRRTFIMFWNGCGLLSAWPFFTILYCLLTNVSDATFLAYNNVDSMAFLAAYFFATDVVGSLKSVSNSVLPSARKFGHQRLLSSA